MSNNNHHHIEQKPLYIKMQINGTMHEVIIEEECFRCLTCAWTYCNEISEGHNEALEAISDIITK